MKLSEVLNKAADLVVERGWTQGADGWAGAFDRESDHAVCLEGALMAARGERWAGEFKPWEFSECDAYKAVEEYLGWTDGRLYRWNDLPVRNATEVIGVLRATAFIAAAREEHEKEFGRERAA